MGKYVNKGNDGFASIRNSNFVDKSMLIAQVNSVLMTDNRFLCVTRARRFGKSVAVKMLNAYYDRSCHSRELFSGLQICGDKDFGKHLNRYPVLYLDMTDFVTKYAGSLSGFAGEVLLVGISYNKKTKRHECRIERWGESLSLSLSKRELVTKLSLSSVQVGLLVESLRKPVLAKELRSLLGFKDPTYFKRNVIDVLSRDGLIAMTKPDKPTSPNQKYYLTEKGKVSLR